MPIPDNIPELHSSGFRALSMDGASGIVIVQRGTEADRVVTAFMEAQIKGRPTPPKVDPPAPATLSGVNRIGIGIFPIGDAAWILIIKMGSPEERALNDWVVKHGLSRIPRPNS